MTRLAALLARLLPQVPARQRLHGARLLTLAMACWAVIGGMALVTFSGKTSANGAVRQRVAETSSQQPLPDAPPDLDALHQDAAGGSGSSMRQLAIALMDRFDRTGDASDLAEALSWIDKGWKQFGDEGPAARIVTHYCGERVVRGSPLCNLGE